ncbi:hypothetical protein TRVA0_028S01376 [Trichomonascus vanleenenianus]|uniref:SPP41 family protein n=1 Tax=Trichomonascus vanleenenianus TaxID=2268995 RepID=UPI003ECAAA00
MAAGGAGTISGREFDSIEAELSALLGAAAASAADDQPKDTRDATTAYEEPSSSSLEGFDENLFANALALALSETHDEKDESSPPPQGSSSSHASRNNNSNNRAPDNGDTFDEEGLAQLEILNNLLSGSVESAGVVSEDHGDIWSKISQITSDNNSHGPASGSSAGNKASTTKPVRPKAKSRAKSRPKVSKYANVGDPTFALNSRSIQPPPLQHRFPTATGAGALSGSIMGSHKPVSKPRQSTSAPATSNAGTPSTTTTTVAAASSGSSSGSSSNNSKPEGDEYDLHTALSKFLDSADADMTKLGVSTSTPDTSSFEQQTAALLQGFLESSDFDFGGEGSSNNNDRGVTKPSSSKSDFAHLSSTFGALSEASSSTPKPKPKKTAATKGKAVKSKSTPRITAANASPANNPLLQELRAQQNRANQTGSGNYSTQPLSARYATVPGVRHPPLPVPAPLPTKAGQKPKKIKSATAKAKAKPKSPVQLPGSSPSSSTTASPTPLSNQASTPASATTTSVAPSQDATKSLSSLSIVYGSSPSNVERPKAPTPPIARPSSSQSLVHDQSANRASTTATATPRSAPATPKMTPVSYTKPRSTIQQSYSLQSGATSSYLQDPSIGTSASNLGQSGSISKPTIPSQQQMRAFTAQPPPPSNQFAYTSSFSIQEKLSKPSSFAPSDRSSAVSAQTSRPKTATPPQLPSPSPLLAQQQQQQQQKPENQTTARPVTNTVAAPSKSHESSSVRSTPSPVPSVVASGKPTGPAPTVNASAKPVSPATTTGPSVHSPSPTPTPAPPAKVATTTPKTTLPTSSSPTPPSTATVPASNATPPATSTVKRPATVSVSTSPRPVVVSTFRGRPSAKSKATQKGPTLSIAETLALTRSNMQKTKDAAPKIDPMLNRKPVFSSYSPRPSAEPYRAPANNYVFSTVKTTTAPRPLGNSQSSQSTTDVEDDPSLAAAMQLVKEAFGSAAQESELNDELSAETMDALQEALQALGKQFEEESKSGAPQTKASRVMARVRRFRSINMNTPEERERIRMENRERKKRWRTFNADRNKDNDLRVRVHKRAHKLFGTEPSEKKTEWIEAEIKKRRARRIQKEKTTERYQLNQNANPAAAAAANSAATVQAASTARAAVAAVTSVAPLSSQPPLSTTIRPGIITEEEEDEVKDDVRILLENLTRNDVDISGALSILAKDSTLLKNISEIFGDDNEGAIASGSARRSASEAFGEDGSTNKRSQHARGSVSFRVQSYKPSLPVVSPTQHSASSVQVSSPRGGEAASPMEVSAFSPTPPASTSQESSDQEDNEIHELAGLLSQAVEILNTETCTTELSVLAGIPRRPPAFRTPAPISTVVDSSPSTNEILSAAKVRHTLTSRSFAPPPLSSGGGITKRAAPSNSPLSTVREKLAAVSPNSPLSFASPKPPQYYTPKRPITIAPPFTARRISEEKRVKSLGFPPPLTGLAQALKR